MSISIAQFVELCAIFKIPINGTPIPDVTDFPINEVSTDITLLPNTCTVCNSTSQLNLTLPTTFNVDDVFQIYSINTGGFIIAQNTGQRIFYQGQSSTVGNLGFFLNTTQGASAQLNGLTANTFLFVKNSNGCFALH